MLVWAVSKGDLVVTTSLEIDMAVPPVVKLGVMVGKLLSFRLADLLLSQAPVCRVYPSDDEPIVDGVDPATP